MSSSTGAGNDVASSLPPSLPDPSLWVQVVAPILFLLAWLGMAFRWPWMPHIGRTLSTLLVAVLCVATGCLTGDEAFEAVNLDTLALLFGTMIMSALLEREGFFLNVQRLWCWGIPNEKGRGAQHLLLRVVICSGLLSALFTNDSWCVVGTPVLLRLCARFRLPYAPFLLAIATSANIGSACSPVGNPQNMLIASASGLSFSQFLRYLLLPTALCLILNALALILVYNKQLHGHSIIWTEAHLEREDGDSAAKTRMQRRQLGIDVDLSGSSVAEEPSPRSAVHRRHSADETGVDDDADTSGAIVGAVVHVRKLSVSATLARIADDASAQQSQDPEHVQAPVSLPPLLDGEHAEANPFLAIDVTSPGGTSSAASLLQREQPQQPLEDEGLAVVHGRRGTAQADDRQVHPVIQGSAPFRHPSAYPDLDLTQEWARAEYIRRAQLQFFYGRHHRHDEAGAGEDGGQGKDKHGPSPPPPTPLLTYVPSERYAPPAALPTAQTDEAAAAATARARAAGVSPPPHHTTEVHESNAGALLGWDEGDERKQTSSASAPRLSAGSNNDSVAGGRLVMQPPSYASLRIPVAAPALPHSALKRWLSSHGLPYRLPAKVHQFGLVLLGTLIAFLAGVPLAWASLGGALVMLALDGADPDATGLWVSGGVDWALLIFFSALFIVVESLRRSAWPDKAWQHAAPYLNVQTSGGVVLYALLVLVGSNTVSNVPLVLILSPSLRALPSPDARHQSWLLLAFISTLAGNLTLVGSVANLIVVARARAWYNLGFVEYAKYGFLSTIVFITLGAAIIELELI